MEPDDGLNRPFVKCSSSLLCSRPSERHRVAGRGRKNCHRHADAVNVARKVPCGTNEPAQEVAIGGDLPIDYFDNLAGFLPKHLAHPDRGSYYRGRHPILPGHGLLSLSLPRRIHPDMAAVLSQRAANVYKAKREIQEYKIRVIWKVSSLVNALSRSFHNPTRTRVTPPIR